MAERLEIINVLIFSDTVIYMPQLGTRLKKCSHTRLQTVYNKSNFNTVHFDNISFTCSCVEGESFNGLKFGTFIGRFSSDSLESMAVKGLTMAHGAGFNNQGDDGYGQ